MKIIESKELLRTRIFKVTDDVARDSEGFEIRRPIIRHPGSAVMMPVDDQDRVLLVRQFRMTANDYLWEFPAGKLDEGEGPLDAAKRELREETGYSAEKWTELASYFSSPGFLQERMTVYLAEELTSGKPEPMDDERIELKWFGACEIDDMIRDRQVQDGKTIIGFLMWQRYYRAK